MLGAGHYSGHTRGKPCAVVIPYGMPGWEGYARTSALVLPGILEMSLVDCWMVHATLPGEGVVTAENREYARRLGMGLFNGADRPKGHRECPYCGSDLFRILPGGAVECPLCLARGKLKEGLSLISPEVKRLLCSMNLGSGDRRLLYRMNLRSGDCYTV